MKFLLEMTPQNYWQGAQRPNNPVTNVSFCCLVSIT
jgi:hypothetical protein